jgi:putative ABC transport system permease protein
MATFASDVRYAVRSMRRNPGFTAVAITALALGIGANTAIFSVVNGVILQPLPFREPDRLVRLGESFPNGGHNDSVSIPKYMAWRTNQVFAGTALYDQGGLNQTLGSGDPPIQLKTLHVSQEFFQVFGAAPALGRVFDRTEDLPGGPGTAILTYRTWQSRFGCDPRIVGRTILLNKRPFTVAGVMQKDFESDPQADAWLALQADPNSTNQGNYLSAAARLKPGLDLSQARAAMRVIAEQFRKANPKWMRDGESVAVIPMSDLMVEDVRPALLILLGAVGLVLLIACANVANLLLARAASRQKEMAVRAAIGAGRWHVVRQLLTESAILAAAGTGLGFALGAWGVRLLLVVAPGNIPRLTDTNSLHAAIPVLDPRVAAFTMAVAVLTVILFGLFPALRASNPDLATALKEGGGRAGTGHSHNRARSLLVIAETALALVLLAGAALLLRSFAGLRSVDPGFNTHHLLAFETSLAGGDYAKTVRLAELVRRATGRLQAVPGVRSVASTFVLPMSGMNTDLPFNIEGRPPAKGDYTGDEQWRPVSPDYFRTLQAPMLHGRSLTERDTGSSPLVVVINEAMAKKYWPKEEALGKVIVIGRGLGPQFEEGPREIVGISGNVTESGLARHGECVMYVPQSQMPNGLTELAGGIIPLAWIVRTAGDPLAIRTVVEREMHSVDAALPVGHLRTVDEVVSQSLARENFNTLLLTLFAGIAVLLAAIGIYGLISYGVEQRMQEIGIRVALGAARGDVLRMIVMQGAKLAAIGVAVGLAAAFGLTRFLASLLYGVKAADPVTFAGVAVAIGLVALAASYIPALRAAAVDPNQALRHE